MNHSLIFDKILYFPSKGDFNKISFENNYEDISIHDIDQCIIRFERNGELVGEGFIYEFQKNEYISVYNQYGVLQLVNLEDSKNIYMYKDVKNMKFKRNILTKREYEYILNNRFLTLFYKVLIADEEYVTNKIFSIDPRYSLYLKKHVFTYMGRNIYEYDVYKIDEDYYIFLIIRNDKKKNPNNLLDIDYVCLNLTNNSKDEEKLHIRYFNDYNNNTSVSDIYKTSKIKYTTNLLVEMLNGTNDYLDLISVLKLNYKNIDLFFYK